MKNLKQPLYVIILFTLFSAGIPIILNNTNHASILGEIDNRAYILFASQVLNRSKTIQYVYIDSVGGFVEDGFRIMNVLSSLPNITCIAVKAYSMAFIILQVCPTRYVLSTSTLMQHQMGAQIDGDISRMSESMHFLHAQNDYVQQLQANRLNVTKEWFDNRTRDEWWIFGNEILTTKCADKIIPYVFCDNSMSFNDCPVV